MRHLKRYSALAKGLYTPEGRKDRKVVVIDVRPSPTSKNADIFLQVTPGADFEIVHVLRLLIAGKRLEGLEEESLVGGVAFRQWQELAELMKACRYGVVMFGIGLTQSRGKDLNAEELNSLIIELNAFTRFYAVAMRGHGNVNGSNQVLAWQTGYPLAVNFQRGYPRFNPGEFSVVDMLRRKEADAALIIATDPSAHLPQSAVNYLKSIPTIYLEPHENATTTWANVVIPVAPAGIGAGGTFYRMDNIPLQLKKLVDFAVPSDLEALQGIKEEVLRLKRGEAAC
ncbi:formylmethanofuran dehydrogenase subunit B [Desulfosporosinus lacus DSM 15449]|uniref:Formylmethanofuran dehydrogenase subunit B n=1 Tax=Desulfosporosinus lacus DSM 15449 TaxID=1121420 RepID=A0A1M5V4N7_9FIRM|nr:formylmethanofuran dehydrogenase subunit B [Desulfosporosinus lacus DSM 15449]